MATWTNLLRGTVTLRAEGPFPERLLNLCARNGVTFWGVEWLGEDGVRLTVRMTGVPRLEELAGRAGCTLVREERRGLPWFLARFRRRYAFLLGLALSLTAVFFLSRFVLVVEVRGNEQVSTAAILTKLRRQGLRPGAYGPGVDRAAVAQESLRALTGLSWMGINIQGTRAVVEVREAQPEPPVEDDSGFYHVTAEADGVILHIQAERGQAAVEEGAVVARGDVLISGAVSVEPPRYSQAEPYRFATHAKGKVWARTWRTLTAVTPLELQVKAPTGREKTGRELELFGTCIPLLSGGKRPALQWAGEREGRRLTLPGVGAVPIGIVTTRWQEHETVPARLELTAAQAMLEDGLKRELERLVGEDGEVLSVAYAARAADGLLRVTAQAECREEIGQEVPAPESDRPAETGGPPE